MSVCNVCVVCVCMHVYACVYRALQTNCTHYFEVLYLSDAKRSNDILDGGWYIGRYLSNHVSDVGY